MMDTREIIYVGYFKKRPPVYLEAALAHQYAPEDVEITWDVTRLVPASLPVHEYDQLTAHLRDEKDGCLLVVYGKNS